MTHTNWKLDGPEPTKEDMLKTFNEQRNFAKDRYVTATERALKSRNTHLLTQTTYYGKRTNRFHNIAGQGAELVYPPTITKEDVFNQNLSSRTYAPQTDGTRVPLSVDVAYEVDPRIVPATLEPRYDSRFDLPKNKFGSEEFGEYYGNQVDRVVSNYEETNPAFEMIIGQMKPRQ
jgi:hypothetical protein